MKRLIGRRIELAHPCNTFYECIVDLTRSLVLVENLNLRDSELLGGNRICVVSFKDERQAYFSGQRKITCRLQVYDEEWVDSSAERC